MEIRPASKKMGLLSYISKNNFIKAPMPGLVVNVSMVEKGRGDIRGNSFVSFVTMKMEI
jgi:acetyl/propionyl-CoA carboxylase alpha subunit